MHELHVTQQIFQAALEQARLQDGERIRSLHITLNPSIGFVPDAIQFYFEQLSQGTAAEGARLTFDVQEQAQGVALTRLEIEEDLLPVRETPHDSARQEPPADGSVIWRFEIQRTAASPPFEAFLYELALSLNLRGESTLQEHTILLELQGTEEALTHFTQHLREDAPDAEQIRQITITALPTEDS